MSKIRKRKRINIAVISLLILAIAIGIGISLIPKSKAETTETKDGVWEYIIEVDEDRNRYATITKYLGGVSASRDGLNVSIPDWIGTDKVMKISPNAFTYADNANQITTITISKWVSNIDYLNLSKCPSLSEILVASGNSSFSADIHYMALFDRDRTKLIAWPPAKSTGEIPSSVETIGKNAFIG